MSVNIKPATTKEDNEMEVSSTKLKNDCIQNINEVNKGNLQNNDIVVTEIPKNSINKRKLVLQMYILFLYLPYI
jgi:hypothetical protein